MVTVYTSLVRPITEYTCQVWHPGLTFGQLDLLESIQECVLAMICSNLKYHDACKAAGLTTLKCCRDDLCKSPFSDLQAAPTHKLHQLLPTKQEITYEQHNANKYPLPKLKTERFKNSLVPYCLFNFNVL